MAACPPHILEAYKNGAFTDLTIACGSLTFEVHQVVVATQCEFLNKCLTFAVGKESEEKRIDLPEDDPEMIRRLIAYLYLGNYDPCSEYDINAFNNIKHHESTTEPACSSHSRCKNCCKGLKSGDQCACLAPNTGNLQQPTTVSKQNTTNTTFERPQGSFEVTDPLTIHAAMYALADKYQVEGLGPVAKRKFISCLCHHANSSDFVTAVQLIYSSTPDSNRGLRDQVVKAFLENFDVDIAAVPGLESKLETIDELSFLLIKSWPQKATPPKPVAKGTATATASGSRATATSAAPAVAIPASSITGGVPVTTPAAPVSRPSFSGFGETPVQPGYLFGSCVLAAGGAGSEPASGRLFRMSSDRRS